MRKIFWFLVVLAVLAVGADRGADYLAEQTIAHHIQSSQHLRSKPAVDVTGFPFLTQLYDQRLGKVVITAKQVPVGQGGRAVRLASLTVTLHDVRTNRRYTQFDASTAAARATLSYAELGRVLGLQVGYGGQGKVRARKTFTVAGKKLQPSATVDPKLVGGALEFTGATLPSGIPAPVATAIQDAFSLKVPLAQLPFGAQITSVRAARTGIKLGLSAQDVRYSR